MVLCGDLVNEALAAMDRDENSLWSLPLVVALESQSEGKALDWSCAVMSESLRSNVSTATANQNWLSELLELKRSRPTSEDLVQRSREIWYHENRRDDVQTAIAKLYEGLAALWNQDAAGYRNCIAIAISVATSSNADTAQRAIELFREYYEKSQDHDGA